MQKVKIIFLFLFFIFSADEFLPQSRDPDEILDRVKKVFERIEDYEVDIHIVIDFEFLKVPESDAKLYFKHPDRVHVESEKFALLPRQGLDFSPLGLLSGKYTALYEKEDTIQNIPSSIVKIIPLGTESAVILSTFWIDQQRDLILKVESSRKPTGTFSIDFEYEKIDNLYELPSSMIFKFTVDKTMYPRGIDVDTESDEEYNESESKPNSGKVYITYSNYKVNRGLQDELFDGEK
jgi:hypothetical protein